MTHRNLTPRDVAALRDANLSRRRFLQDSACGFGALAFAGLGSGRALAASTDPLAPKLLHAS